MKNLFSLIILAATAMFVACEPATQEQGLTITSGKEYKVTANGGDVYITYVGADAVATTIIEGQEAIASIKTPTSGVIVVNFHANTSGSPRSAVVEVSAGNGDFTTLLLFFRHSRRQKITPKPVASVRPREPPRPTGLPVIMPGKCWPVMVSYSSSSHIMCWPLVITSGAGTSMLLPSSRHRRRI